MIVNTDFYCSKTKKSHKRGTEYKGKRKDLGDNLISKKDFDEAEAAKAKANAEIEKADAKRAKLNGQFGTAKHKADKPKKK